MSWVAIDIGCIECGMPSGVIGVFDSKVEADAEVERWYDEFGGFTNGGQHSYEVFNLDESIARPGGFLS